MSNLAQGTDNMSSRAIFSLALRISSKLFTATIILCLAAAEYALLAMPDVSEDEWINKVANHGRSRQEEGDRGPKEFMWFSPSIPGEDGVKVRFEGAPNCPCCPYVRCQLMLLSSLTRTVCVPYCPGYSFCVLSADQLHQACQRQNHLAELAAPPFQLCRVGPFNAAVEFALLRTLLPFEPPVQKRPVTNGTPHNHGEQNECDVLLNGRRV